jgi:acetolactate synthase-1/2/3 large subunit
MSPAGFRATPDHPSDIVHIRSPDLSPSASAPTLTVGELTAAFLEACGVHCAFGVISIHNMPILDAMAQRGAIRFVPARGEAGACNMADAQARVTGTLGVCITSTGTGAGNAAGAMVEALTAGTPLLHLTGQIETPYLDRDLAYIHEAPDQLTMLKSVSKAAFRVRSADTALATLRKAVQVALTAPAGPVSVEIPIDIQQARVPRPADLSPLPVPLTEPDPAALDSLAQALAGARRPLLWLGGGARHAGAAVQRLLALGFGVVTSTQGRGIVREDHPQSLGAYNLQPPVERFYATCDTLLVVGSRLRGNETLKYALKLPKPLHRIDADAAAQGRGYADEIFVAGDAKRSLEGLADRLEAVAARRGGRLDHDPTFLPDLRSAHEAAVAALHRGLGPYSALVQALQSTIGRNALWVRDVTLSNSTWGNRELRLFQPRAGVHALGGGIGQGLAMAIGAAVAAQVAQATPGPSEAPVSAGPVEAAAASPQPLGRTWCLSGDGGFTLNLGELATAAQERCDLVVLLMNDRGYGVIRNIQDAQYGGRRCYVDLHTPDFAALAGALGIRHRRIERAADFEPVLREIAAQRGSGPLIIEIDMVAVGPFATAFAGPPVKPATDAKP